MTVALAEPFVPKNYLAAQDNRLSILNRIYDGMPTRVKVATSAQAIAESIGSTYAQVYALLRTLDACGVTERSTGWVKARQGRIGYVTLLCSREEAIKRFTDYADTSRSLKVQILAALNNATKFKTIDDLVKKVSIGGAGYHNLTHVLYALKSEGKIKFDIGTSSDHIPYNIRLAKPVMRYQVVEPVIIESKHVPEPVAETPTSEDQSYPLITRLIKRREWLESAAKLAEDAQEEDIAITLLERANKPLTPFEEEVVALYYNCKVK